MRAGGCWSPGGGRSVVEDWEEKTNRNNSPILPKSIPGLIVGKSGCGKTNLLLNLLLKPELLDYNS